MTVFLILDRVVFAVLVVFAVVKLFQECSWPFYNNEMLVIFCIWQLRVWEGELWGILLITFVLGPLVEKLSLRLSRLRDASTVSDANLTGSKHRGESSQRCFSLYLLHICLSSYITRRKERKLIPQATLLGEFGFYCSAVSTGSFNVVYSFYSVLSRLLQDKRDTGNAN